MQVGDLANDAITNTEIIGKTRPELAGVTIYEVDILDKMGREREPDSIRSYINGDYINITKERLGHSYGKTSGTGTFGGYWQIEGNKLIVKGSDDQRVATLAEVFPWTIVSVTFGNNVVTDVTLIK